MGPHTTCSRPTPDTLNLSNEFDTNQTDSGFDLSHFEGKCPSNVVSCSIWGWQLACALRRYLIPTPEALHLQHATQRTGPRTTSLPPLSTEFDTDKIVKTRSWPWPEPFYRQTSFKRCKMFPLLRLAGHGSAHHMLATPTNLTPEALNVSSEFGSHKTVKARLWPWLESGLGLSHFTGKCCEVFP